MYIRFLLKIILIFSFNVSLPALAIDQEFKESYRCVALFSLFEKQHYIPLDTLHSISLKESAKKHSKYKISFPWPWTVNLAGKGYYFNNKQEAINFVKKQIFSGKENIDIGCMQINLKHHISAFENLEEAFDPYMNISYAAQFLKNKYDSLQSWHEAIAHYHSANSKYGNKYKQDVIKIANRIDDHKLLFSKYLTLTAGDIDPTPQLLFFNNKLQKKALKNKGNEDKDFTIGGRTRDRLKSNLMVKVYHKIK